MENSSAPASSEPRRTQGHNKSSSDSMYLIAASVIIGLLTLRSGLFNALLVLVCSGLLLCNPWVRTLLELEAIASPRTGRNRSTPAGDGGASNSSGSSSRQARATFDPESHLYDRRSVDEATGTKTNTVDTQVVTASGNSPPAGIFDISVMPVELREPVRKTLPFVVRDFVQFWYEPITFAHPSFLNHSGASFEHLFASIYLHTTRMNSVDFSHNLILTFTSLLIAALRQRREELGVDMTQDAQIGLQDPSLNRAHSWPTTAARIASLRASIGRFLFVHLPAPERHSALVRSLLQEILVKQIWDGVVSKMGNGEFWDQKIVEWNVDSKKPVVEATQKLPAGATMAPQPRSASQTGTSKPSAPELVGIPPSTQKVTKASEAIRSPAPYQSRQSSAPQRQSSGSDKPAASFGRFTSNLFSGFVTAAAKAGEVVSEAMDEAGDAMMGPPQGLQRTGSPAQQASKPVQQGRSASPGPLAYQARSRTPASKASVPPPVEDLIDFSRDMPRSTQQDGTGKAPIFIASGEGSPTSSQRSPIIRKPVAPYEIPDYASAGSGDADNDSASSSSRQKHSFAMNDTIMRSDLPRELPDVPLPDSLRSSLPSSGEAQAPVPTRATMADLPVTARNPSQVLGNQSNSLPADDSGQNLNLEKSKDLGEVANTFSTPPTPQHFEQDQPQPPTPTSASTATSHESSTAPSLASLLDVRTMASSELFNAFEGYLSQRTAADSADEDQPTHGEMLFRLWTQLRTLRSIGEIEMQTDSGLGIMSGPGAGGMRLWAEDVKGALMGRHGSATRLDKDRKLESARDESIGMLERVDVHGLNALDPLDEAVEAKLQKLYASFWMDRAGRIPAKSELKASPKPDASSKGAVAPVKVEPYPIPPLATFDQPVAVKQETTTPRRKVFSQGPISTTSPTQPSPRRASMKPDFSPKISSPLSTDGSGPFKAAASPTRPPLPPPTARLRQDQLDTMISAIFQVAHEALGLSTGAWTLRRGMLRVLEQICRTAYASLLLNSFNSSVSALSTKGVGEYIDSTRESWWPNGEWASTPVLSKEEQREEALKKRERSIQAREIVRSFAPAQAGYVLGPGGRQACVAALDAVYETLTHPITSLDISLTLTLEVLDSLTVVA
ncbi:unnamed protein product [Tilletia laevis]|nr:unnamed protein product [Tilletia laevis]CAD6964924.1 unnamed protein product [Tilletia controversa]CAD6977814.1 unnamed protein product [Tilletia controversa]CAD7068691.1 unnamed protein product [Tilletia caries]